MNLSNARDKRSLLPIIGKALSFLFGTVSESDLKEINKNINILAENQEQIIHDLDLSISVLNMSRIEIAKNRHDIMDIVKCILNIDTEIRGMKETSSKHILRLEQFMTFYMQFYLLVDELKTMSRNAMIYLENLKIELNSLSLNQLSIHTISPTDLRKLLLNIQSKSQNNLQLPVDPNVNILSCVAYLENNEIRIVMENLLINTKEHYNIDKIHNLPMPVISSTDKGLQKFTVKYSLEGNNLMLSEDRTKFRFLSDNEFQACTNTDVNFCSHEQALYTTSFSKYCYSFVITRESKDKEIL